MLLVLSEGPDSNVENVKVGYNNLAKWNVDKGSQEDSQVRHDEVHDEDLLGQCLVIRLRRLIILELGQTGSSLGQDGIQNRIDSCENASWDEDLVGLVKSYAADRIQHSQEHSLAGRCRLQR